MSGFDNIGLCLFDVKLMGGLAFMTNFQKTMNSSESINHHLFRMSSSKNVQFFHAFQILCQLHQKLTVG